MRLGRLAGFADWRYAIGEVILIVIGVSLALAATSWYERKLDRRDEILILEQLRQTLNDDLQNIDATWEMTRNRERAISSLLEHLESTNPYTPELAPKFQALFGWRTVRLKTAPFEALKAQAYTVISNVELRHALMSFYEDHYARLEYNSFLDRDLAIGRIQPYFFEHFVLDLGTETDVDLGAQSWTPKDYHHIKADSYIANMCRYRADILRRFVLRDYEHTTTAMREILDLLAAELDAYE